MGREGLIEKFAEWYYTPINERDPINQKEFSKKWNVSEVTLSKWKKNFEKEVYSDQAEHEAFMDKLKAMATTGKPTSRHMEIYAKLKGWYTEKPEEKVELSAYDYIQIGNRVIQGFRDNLRERGGNCSVCGQPVPIPEEPLLDNQQEHSQPSEVAAVGVPERPA